MATSMLENLKPVDGMEPEHILLQVEASMLVSSRRADAVVKVSSL
ncbi:MAG: hypothetical protein CFH06_00671, partial [Alphaproteobacteria bacterium MarineAlpha3_Bin5]